MNKKAIVPLVLGLGIGLLAVKFGIDAIRRAQASNENKATVTVIKAKQDINAFDKIESNMIEAVETVESPFIPTNERVNDVDKVVGRVAGKAIPRGAPVLRSMIAPEGTTPGLQGRIEPGYRAVSVKIDEVNSASYQLRPGVFVDVTVVMDVATDNRRIRGGKETVSEVILQRVEVASIGYGSQNDAQEEIGKVKPAKSATLLIRKDDVAKLHLAQTRGKIALALRGDDDNDASTMASANGEQLFRGGKSDDAPGMFEEWMALMAAGAQTAGATQPQPQSPQDVDQAAPHGVLVFHHSSLVGEDQIIERMMFKSPESAQLLSIQIGAPSRASAAMREDNAGIGG